ncbi:DUF4179 domain-containing protein [Saccharibacillus alkalitolerans]|uniref:DUF4179 domain-containing protein n=1 Tax=Saccharibacillus alkalitolerans TaxID=2705290 RepID=A0ABX0F1R7_9BACL|nr:DUF4179 domain-containing protein [Saccharibacillus alkalitolerans]NGZ74916.1 DUF4179 domain-containing protein [Saccharibacillus alkalitolerans]
MKWRPNTGAGKAAYSPRETGGGEEEKRTEQHRPSLAEGSEERSEELPEDARWTELLSAETLPEDFTERFMAELESLEIEAEEDFRAAEHEGQSADSGPRGPYRKKWAARKSFWAAAAAVLLLAGGLLVYTQPTIAERFRSLFAADSYADTGMREAREAGMVADSDAAASDAGYTLKVQEVIADSTRMVISVAMFDKDGKPAAGTILGAHYRIFDDQGEIPFRSGSGGNPSIDRRDFTFGRSAVGSEVSLYIEADEIAVSPGENLSDGSQNKTIKGSWNLLVKSDLSKANALSKTTRIEESYETPHGLRIEMLGTSRTPSGGTLEFETFLNAEARKRAEGGAQGKHSVYFRIESGEGESLADNLQTQFNASSTFDRWSGRTRWFCPFNNFPSESRPLRFVLDSYVIEEQSDASVSFRPEELSKDRPAEFADSGDRFAFTGFAVGPDPNGSPESSVGILTFSGHFNNPEFPSDTWIAVDESGRGYPLTFRGAVTSDTAGGELDGDQQFIAEGMTSLPKRLTIKRTAVHRLYRDADWSFQIPQTGSSGVVPE